MVRRCFGDDQKPVRRLAWMMGRTACTRTGKLALLARICLLKLYFRQGYASKPPGRTLQDRHSCPIPGFRGKVMVSMRQSYGLSHSDDGVMVVVEDWPSIP